MTSLSPATVLAQLACLLESLDGPAVLHLEAPGHSHLWHVGPALPSEDLADREQPWHREDFRLVRWPGLGDFTLTPKQADVVRALWRAWEEGRLPVHQRELLAAAGSDCLRLADLFKRSPAWGHLILLGELPGTYTLPRPEKRKDQP